MLSQPHICHLSNYYPLSVTFICQKEAALRHRLFEPSKIRFEFRFRFGLHIYGNVKLIKRWDPDAHLFTSRSVWNAHSFKYSSGQNESNGNNILYVKHSLHYTKHLWNTECVYIDTNIENVIARWKICQSKKIIFMYVFQILTFRLSKM